MNERAKIRDVNERVGFVQLSWLIVLDRSISDGAKITYCVLKRHAIKHEEVWPSQVYVSRVLGIDVATVKRHISELIDRGLVTVEPPSPPTHPTNTYYFEPPSSVSSEAEIRLAERIPASRELDSLLPPVEAVVADRERTKAGRAKLGSAKTRSGGAQKRAVGEGAKTPPKGILSTEVQERENPAACAAVVFAPREKTDEGTTRTTQSEDEKKTRWRRPEEDDFGHSAVKTKQLEPDAPVESASEPEDEEPIASEPKPEPKPEVPAPRVTALPDKPETDQDDDSDNPSFTTPPPERKRRPRRSDAPPRKKGISPETAAIGMKVFELWLATMRERDPKFGSAAPTDREKAMGAKLRERFPESEGDMLLKVLRVAAWDWRAIQVAMIPWYTATRPIPTLPVLLYLADYLAAAVNRGVIAPPNHRTSDYYEKWVSTRPQSTYTDPLSLRAKAEGKTPAEIAMDRAQERKKKARRDAATG